MTLLSLDNESSAPSSIAQTLRFIEWMLLIVIFCLKILNLSVFKLTHSSYLSQLIPSPLDIFCFVGCFGLSFIFPANRPLWQRRLYVFLEILFILPIQISGFIIDSLFYLTFVKACFLLKRKDVFISVIATGLAFTLIRLWILPYYLRLDITVLENIINDLQKPTSLIIYINDIVNELGIFFAASIFMILFSFVLLAERKSRQRAEALAKEVETLAAKLERTRIAREIHDSLGHTLTSLDVQLELAQRLRSRNPQQATEAVDTAKVLAEQCIQDVRRALQTMRKSDFNFEQALQELVGQVQQSQKFTVHLRLDLPSLPLQVSHQLYCIVQEGLTNVQKHARASVVKIDGWAIADRIYLRLTDNGKGFNVEKPSFGFGLKGMWERVQILGGEIEIDSTPKIGTQIQVTIPCESPSSLINSASGTGF